MSPKVRQSIYLLGTIVPAALGLLLLWGGVGTDTAGSLNQIITGVVALLGAGAPAVAASQVSKQRKDGTLDTLAPADQVINGVQAVIEAQAQATAELERVKNAVSTTVGIIPGVGPLAQQVINSVPTDFDFRPRWR